MIKCDLNKRKRYTHHPIFVSTENQNFHEQRNLLMESNLMNFNNFSVILRVDCMNNVVMMYRLKK